MSDQPKALIILSPGFPKDEADSTCVPAQQVFVKNFKQNFPRLTIIVLAFQYPYKAAEYQWNGVTVISFGGENNGGVFRCINWIKLWLKLLKLNRKYNVIGLLSFWLGECSFIGSKFAKQYKLKHYCWILGQDAKEGNKYCKHIKPAPDDVIALSDFIAAEFRKNYGITPAKVIPIGVDPAMFGAPAAERDIDILGAGSLIPLKQYAILVNLVSVLRSTFPEIKVVICGKGPEDEALNTMIANLGLENNITLMGEISHTDVLALMQRAKVFVHPSSYEGFGVVCIEALYAGAQVVSFVRPMQADIKNWHFAHTQPDMQDIVKGLLEDPRPDHSSVALYLAEDTSTAMMKLFGYSKETGLNWDQ